MPRAVIWPFCKSSISTSSNHCPNGANRVNSSSPMGTSNCTDFFSCGRILPGGPVPPLLEASGVSVPLKRLMSCAAVVLPRYSCTQPPTHVNPIPLASIRKNSPPNPNCNFCRLVRFGCCLSGVCSIASLFDGNCCPTMQPRGHSVLAKEGRNT